LLDTLPAATGGAPGSAKSAAAVASASAGSAAAARDAAIALLRSTGLPTKKTEAWRFTSVKSIVERALPVAPTSLTPPHTDVVRFVGGHPVLPTAPRSPAVSLARVAAETSSALGLGAFEPESAHPFAALNTALFSDALVVKVKGVAERPLFVDHVAFENERADTAAYARIRVELAANAELVLVERYRGASALSDSVVEIVLGENAKLVHLRTHEDEGALIGSVFVRQARGSRYVSHALSFYGAPTRLDLRVRLEGEGAECSLDGVALVAGEAHSDHHVRVDHAAPRTTSRMRHRAVVSDRATSVFDGQAHVLPGAAGCEAHQHSRNLLLSDRGTVHTKPHLEIHVDEVVASHGATVGALDPDALFYLRARGISEADAKTLLTYAFLQELVDAIEHPALRTAMRDALLSQLPGGELVRALEDETLDFSAGSAGSAADMVEDHADAEDDG
jgi:Fe-S cluster assembly protein SufD